MSIPFVSISPVTSFAASLFISHKCCLFQNMSCKKVLCWAWIHEMIDFLTMISFFLPKRKGKM